MCVCERETERVYMNESVCVFFVYVIECVCVCVSHRDINMFQIAQWQKPIFQDLISRVLFEIETRG